MRILKYLGFISCLIFSSHSIALSLTEINQPLDDGLYDSRSCNDLYLEATALEKESFIYKNGNQATMTVASIASTVFTPALYFVGYNAFKNFKSEKQSQTALSKIEEVRYRLAEKRCFTK
jgi:hypothetical protein